MDSFALIPHSVTENVSAHMKDEIICVDSQPPRCLRSGSVPVIQGKRMGELNRMLFDLATSMTAKSPVWWSKMLCCHQHFVHKSTVNSLERTPYHFLQQ